MIRTYLKKIKSDLFKKAAKMDFSDLCQKINIIDGPKERIYSKNVGLMFFNDDPSIFFPQTQIDIVHFPEGEGADTFSEKIYKGPLDIMLNNALGYLKSNIIEEKIIKYPDKAESDRYYNYPYIALEEILCNAVYHRSYEIREPVEVRILPDKITISSFPGPDRSIRDGDIKKNRFVKKA